jgi:hypothetical protein
MADGEFVPAGTLIRIRTTGGGWGDPLERDRFWWCAMSGGRRCHARRLLRITGWC